MGQETGLDVRLRELREDYVAVTGHPFKYFHCPILWSDEDVELCRGHIVNQAFATSDRTWTVQRADVDSFYGSLFEAQFVKLQDKGRHRPLDVLVNPSLSRRVQPGLNVGGVPVEYYRAKGPVPSYHSELHLGDIVNPIRLGLKLEPSETLDRLSADWQLQIKQDLRLPALASLLKAAHLTLFELVGYTYALSAGGRFVGREILAPPFLQTGGKARQEQLDFAESHFRSYVNLVRPMLDGPEELCGTISNGLFHLCFFRDRPWAFLVTVRTGQFRHAVLLPIFDDSDSAAWFLRFLESPSPHLEARLAKFDDEQWMTARDSSTFIWPQANYEQA